MDGIPAHNTHYIRPAVITFEKQTNKENKCAALSGEARHRCYELAMPT